MATSSPVGAFPSPYSIETPPGCEGWEEIYPYHAFFAPARRKPSKAAVAVIAERLELPTAEIAVIGDDLGMDIGLGHLGNSRTVLVQSGISGQLDLTKVPEHRRPDATISTIGDLLALL